MHPTFSSAAAHPPPLRSHSTRRGLVLERRRQGVALLPPRGPPAADGVPDAGRRAQVGVEEVLRDEEVGWLPGGVCEWAGHVGGGGMLFP